MTENGKVCGSCTLCCKLVPVESLGKKAGQRCQHQRHGSGCGIYPHRPEECRRWSCAWLAEPAASVLPRPDRAHYVIDALRDTTRLMPEDGSPGFDFDVVQVWCDPAFPEAWNTPELFGYAEHVARSEGAAVLVRWGNKLAMVLIAPCISPTGRWYQGDRSPPQPGFGRFGAVA